MALNDYKDYCRLCQSNIGTTPIINNNGLLKKITDITKIKITDCNNIRMPPNICSSCQQKVIDIQHFIDMVQKIDEHLRSLESIQGVLLKESCTNDNRNTGDTLKCEKMANEDANQQLVVIGIGTEEYKCYICSETYQNFSFYTKCEELICKAISEIETKTSQKCGDDSMVEKLRRKHKAKARIKRIDYPSVHEDVDNIDEPFDEENLKETSKKQNYPCTDKNCTGTFPSQYSLKIHQLNHEGNPRPFLCVTCGKDFATRNSLTCHEKIHSHIKGYRCDMCNIDFSVRSNLRAHIRKYHEGVRFQCSQCSKQFLTKCSLERHEKLHTGVKEFKCENCTAEFYTNKELMKHQRYHQGLKLHKCQVCFKSFFERHHLIVHLRSHSGERPYVCDIPGCGKSFVESQKLKRHHKAKHIAK